jgi:hypothetical protein
MYKKSAPAGLTKHRAGSGSLGSFALITKCITIFFTLIISDSFVFLFRASYVGIIAFFRILFFAKRSLVAIPRAETLSIDYLGSILQNSISAKNFSDEFSSSNF